MGKRSMIPAMSIFMLSLCVYIFFANGHYGGDAISNYLTTRSILQRCSIDISMQTFDVKEIKVEEVGFTGNNGRVYSPFGIGMPLLQIPFYLIGLMLSWVISQLPAGYATYFAVSFTNTVVSAINVLLIFLIVKEISANAKDAISLALIYGFSTVALVYSKVGFTEPAMIMFMLTGFYLLLFKNRSHSLPRIFLAGVACGLMFLVRVYSVIMIASFIFYIFLTSKNKIRDIAVFMICPLLFMAGVLSLNYYQLGGVFKTGYGSLPHVIEPGDKLLKAFYYYFFSSGKGIFLYNPVLILSLFCVPAFFRKRRAEALFILSLILINLVFFLHIFERGSIFSWGPRYIFILVPLFCIFLIEGFDSLPRRLTMLLSAVAGLIIQTPALFVNFSKYIYFVKERLLLNEYMINFIPDLSPIKGTWMLFMSRINYIFKGSSLNFTYSPDVKLVKPIVENMQGYDVLDLWFSNIIGYNGTLRAPVYIALSVIFAIFLLSLISLSRSLRCKDE